MSYLRLEESADRRRIGGISRIRCGVPVAWVWPYCKRERLVRGPVLRPELDLEACLTCTNAFVSACRSTPRKPPPSPGRRVPGSRPTRSSTWPFTWCHLVVRAVRAVRADVPHPVRAEAVCGQHGRPPRAVSHRLAARGRGWFSGTQCMSSAYWASTSGDLLERGGGRPYEVGVVGRRTATRRPPRLPLKGQEPALTCSYTNES